MPDQYAGYAVHQVAPYIGKVRPSLARQLIISFSKRGDWIWDPFCGSGTVPYECRLLSRHTIAGDVNPYACAITRAKLHAPANKNIPISQLLLASKALHRAGTQSDRSIPAWVKRFFHERTLSETLFLAREFRARGGYFNLGCLLGILHHQRPGFLSYPASHLVPYLRDRLFPRSQYPDAYAYRDPVPRLIAKVTRQLKNPPPPRSSHFAVFLRSALDCYLHPASVDAVISSPPYMNALDYARDNRLRLWFLGVDDYTRVEREELRRISSFRKNALSVMQILARAIRPTGKCVLILGDVSRSGGRHDAAELVCEIVAEHVKGFSLQDRWTESIPGARRARRNGAATKTETVLVFDRTKRGGYA
jgi:hypothetical protein